MSSIEELLLRASRAIIAVTSGAYLIWQLVVTAGASTARGLQLAPITLAMIAVSVLALWLMPRWFLAGQIVWLSGMALVITLALLRLRDPTVAYFFATLPLMATVTLGWPAGLSAELFIIATMALLSPAFGALPADDPLIAVNGLVVAGLGGLSGAIGWTAVNALLTVTDWSLYSFEQARVKMEEARLQSMELKQVQEDLIQANRELNRLTERLKVMQQVADEARQAKAEFVANVSHELRTPLNMIIGFSEMITQSPQVYGQALPPALMADITAIQRNSQHLSGLVEDVLDLSQIDGQRMTLVREWVFIEDLVDSALTAVRVLFESKQLYLETGLAPDLPPLFCDGTRVRQVLINLLGNAGRFTEEGGVRVAVRRDGDDVVFSVTDTGPGIPEEGQGKIFEPFQQLDGSIRRRYGGSGLGLSISKQFIEMHDGKMWLASEVGVGTTFFFSIPLTSRPSALARDDGVRRWFNPYKPYEPRTRPFKAPVQDIGPRYLVVEMGETLQRLFSRYLPDSEFVSVGSIGKALEVVETAPVQAILINAPPDYDGLDQLKELPYGIPAVVFWLPGRDEVARELGIVDYLVKPISRTHFLDALERLDGDVERVLVVDDRPEVLQLFARMLASAPKPYRVLRASGGRQALHLLRTRDPDVMVLDLMMPDVDGFQVLQEKGRDPAIRDVPVIVISSRDATNAPITSNKVMVVRGEGMSVRDLLASVEAISEILSPVRALADGRADPEHPGTPDA